jgi:hypothetical protein
MNGVMLNRVIRIGVVGYSTQKFNEAEALDLIQSAFNAIEKHFPKMQKTVVSGLTDVGIPGLAYREALNRNWRTIGIACSKATEYDLFPVDKSIIVGKNWGDESETFLKSIDVLIRIGGGKQSLEETKEFKSAGTGTVIEYELNTL